ncbi:MAG: T9SS type A sorting domain-containing protein, partial [Flavobacteriales bacterium]|nr:T9SS type A sorting domain-containing protein [Flavobacteriales bacterium]
FLGLILVSSAANSQTIFAIQNTTATNGDSPQLGNVVTTTGVVTAVVLNGSTSGTFFIQDGAGSWNGLYIFESGTAVSIGDNVTVTGTVLEFNNTTELGSVSNITINSSGNTLPTATVLSTTNVNQEEYEGVLVEVQNANATSVGATLGFGLWEVNDGSGGIQVDDDIFPYANIAVLNNTYSVIGPAQFSFGTFKILPRDINDIGGASAPNFVSIFNIQNTVAGNGDSPEDGNTLTTKGIVTAVVLNGPGAGSFFLQDGNGAWNGLYIFETGTAVSIGDSITVTGTVDEFNSTTELVSVSNITIMNSNNTLPTATILSTTNVSQEDYEGVLVQVKNATATSVGATLGFGLWEVNDGSGAVQIDDDIFPYANIAVLSTNYDVTGPVQYSFGTFKILPRDINDISIATAIESLDNVNVSVYPNPVKNSINFKLDINAFNVNILDVTGKTVKTITSLNNKLTISTSNLNNGVYFYSITDVDGNFVSTNKFVVAK